MEHLPASHSSTNRRALSLPRTSCIADLFLGVLTWAIGRWTTTMYALAPIESIVVLIVTVGIIFGLIKCIGLGRKWARVVLLVLFLLGLVVYPWTLAGMLKASILVATLSLLQTILQAIALYYLFSRSGTEWFNRVQEKTHDEPVAR